MLKVIFCALLISLFAFAAVEGSVGDICSSKLPSQAHDTLQLIQDGGPYPFPQDGEVFRNKGSILPAQNEGFYHEYTVITPGGEDRGDRYIVTGDDGAIYYSGDNFATFDRVDQNC